MTDDKLKESELSARLNNDDDDIDDNGLLLLVTWNHVTVK